MENNSFIETVKDHLKMATTGYTEIILEDRSLYLIPSEYLNIPGNLYLYIGDGQFMWFGPKGSDINFLDDEGIEVNGICITDCPEEEGIIHNSNPNKLWQYSEDDYYQGELGSFENSLNKILKLHRIDIPWEDVLKLAEKLRGLPQTYGSVRNNNKETSLSNSISQICEIYGMGYHPPREVEEVLK